MLRVSLVVPGKVGQARLHLPWALECFYFTPATVGASTASTCSQRRHLTPLWLRLSPPPHVNSSTRRKRCTCPLSHAASPFAPPTRHCATSHTTEAAARLSTTHDSSESNLTSTSPQSLPERLQTRERRRTCGNIVKLRTSSNRWSREQLIGSRLLGFRAYYRYRYCTRAQHPPS